MVKLFRKRPVVIEAIQYNGINGDDIVAFGEGAIYEGDVLRPTKINPMGCFCFVRTREGIIIGIVGDWFIKGVEGEFYPCGNEIFNKTYEAMREGYMSEGVEPEVK